MATIYRKTPKGQSEIETRALKLAPRFRSLLILVDGRRSDAELLQLMPAAGADGLEALQAGGLIEAIGVTSETPAASARPPAPVAENRPAPAPSRKPSFEKRRQELVRALTDQVGPMAETLAVRIERAAGESELAPLLELAVKLVGNVRGRAAAEAFRERHAAGDSG